MKIIFQPHNLLGILGLILLVLSFIFTKKNIYIRLSDTYYIVPLTYIFQIFAALLFFFFIVYRLTGYFLFSSWLTWVHIALTILAMVIIVLLPFLTETLSKPKTSNVNWKEWANIGSFDRANQTIVIASLGLMIAQLAYVVNIAGGIIKKLI